MNTTLIPQMWKTVSSLGLPLERRSTVYVILLTLCGGEILMK